MLADLGHYGESSASHCGERGNISVSSGDFGHEIVCSHREKRTDLTALLLGECA